jgi:cytochrome b561
MVMTNRKSMRDYSSRIALAKYDRTTIVLHWLTVALVIALFALAESWGFLRHGAPLRKEFQSLHISLGVLLAGVLAVRLGWRATRGSRLPAAVTGLQELAAQVTHYALYLLLIVQVVLGFLYRWAQGEPFMFFGLFPIQFATSKNSTLDDAFGSLHNIVAWLIIVLAGFHAAAALIHYYLLKDGVLQRMLPR